jgi:hypothetical protein
MEKTNDGQSDVSAGISKLDIWEKIQRYYMLLKGLYENRSLYHKIGYLIAVSGNPVLLIDECQKRETKSGYEDYLNKKIAESIGVEDYLDLSYEKDKDKLSKLLLLFNVETTNQIEDNSARFPFDKYKDTRWWSLEHIHAQHSERLNKEDQWKAYLKYHRTSLEETVKKQFPDKAEKIGELIAKIDTALESKITEEIFRPLSQEIAVYFLDDVSKEKMHRLSNMALLSVPDNAALNNSAFDVKRTKILELDKNGEFIPICTRRVFLKYYSDSSNSPLCFWTGEDRKDYLKEMNRVLRPYLSIIGKEIKEKEKDI